MCTKKSDSNSGYKLKRQGSHLFVKYKISYTQYKSIKRGKVFLEEKGRIKTE